MKYFGKRIDELTAEQCREAIESYGDLTNELNAGHDPKDTKVWQAILADNYGCSTSDVV